MKTPPAYGESVGPMMVAFQWNMSSSETGPAWEVGVPKRGEGGSGAAERYMGREWRRRAKEVMDSIIFELILGTVGSGGESMYQKWGTAGVGTTGPLVVFAV